MHNSVNAQFCIDVTSALTWLASNCLEAANLHSYESCLHTTSMTSTLSKLFMTSVLVLLAVCMDQLQHMKADVPVLPLRIHLQEASIITLLQHLAVPHSSPSSQPHVQHSHVVCYAGRMSISVHVENSLTSALQHLGRHALQIGWMSTRRTCHA